MQRGQRKALGPFQQGSKPREAPGFGRIVGLGMQLTLRLDDKTKQFLLTLQDGDPDFAAINRSQAVHLPAVQWKLLNLNKLKRENPAKHAAQRDALVKLLG
jgi:hypothetical protein